MDSIVLTSQNLIGFTAISNSFIDNYMPYAHGDYVKIYLYLLRCLNSKKEISISSLADQFENTEKDIIRAIQYWEQKKLLSVNRNQNGGITEISFCTPPMPEQEKKQNLVLSTNHSEDNKANAIKSRPVYTSEQIACMKEDPQVILLLSQIEQVLQRLLKPNDIQLILYLYESLGFPTDLILYLYHYCISMNKTHINYIDRVAANWSRDGIRTVEQAKIAANQYKQYKKEYSTIAKTLGFHRSLAEAECEYIDKWLQVWSFPLETVLEACKRTILQTQNPSFHYIDRILEAWHKTNIFTLNDVQKADNAFNKASVEKPKQTSIGNVHTHTSYQKSKNRFTSFEQHNYSKDEMELIERAMLHSPEKNVRKGDLHEPY